MYNGDKIIPALPNLELLESLNLLKNKRNKVFFPMESLYKEFHLLAIYLEQLPILGIFYFHNLK